MGGGEAEAPAVYKVSDKGYTINLQNSVVTDLLSFYQDLTGMTLIKDTAILEGPPRVRPLL
jgi:hypothetical protein